jgi:hypothetical protein
MINSNLLKKIAIVLFVIVIFLLIADAVIIKITSSDERPKNKKELSGIEINTVFNTALKNYGIYDQWISKKKLKNFSGDSLFTTYSIKIPKTLSVHLLILELQNLFWEDDVNVLAEEIKQPSKTFIKIISANHLKLAAEVLYDDKIKREYGSVAFLISDNFVENDPKLLELLKIPELYYLVLTPSSNSKKNLSILSKAGKRFAVLLDDNITELDYKLAENYSEDRIKRSIREIVGTFHNAMFFIIDDFSDLYESSKYNFIENELLKRKIVVAKKSRFNTLNSNNINVEDKFQKFIQSLNNKDEKILFVNADEYLSLAEIIPAYRKIGYKFIYPGDIIVKR